MCEAVHFPDWFSCCFPQPSADTVKEVIQFSKDTLEKINKARVEGQYHEVSPGSSHTAQERSPVLLYIHDLWMKQL